MSAWTLTRIGRARESSDEYVAGRQARSAWLAMANAVQLLPSEPSLCHIFDILEEATIPNHVLHVECLRRFLRVYRLHFRPIEHPQLLVSVRV